MGGAGHNYQSFAIEQFHWSNWGFLLSPGTTLLFAEKAESLFIFSTQTGNLSVSGLFPNLQAAPSLT